MYMNYLLNHELIGAMEDNGNDDNDINKQLNNTYILALDGHVQFEPEAVSMLLQSKQNPDIGAICSRIHPKVNGIIYFYQVFEYAIGHWLKRRASICSAASSAVLAASHFSEHLPCSK